MYDIGHNVVLNPSQRLVCSFMLVHYGFLTVRTTVMFNYWRVVAVRHDCGHAVHVDQVRLGMFTFVPVSYTGLTLR